MYQILMFMWDNIYCYICMLEYLESTRLKKPDLLVTSVVHFSKLAITVIPVYIKGMF